MNCHLCRSQGSIWAAKVPEQSTDTDADQVMNYGMHFKTSSPELLMTLLHSSLASWHAYCFWPWQDTYQHKWVHGKWKGECSLAFHLETGCVSIYVLVLCTCSFDMA